MFFLNRWCVLLLTLVLFSHTQARDSYLEVSDWLADKESCPFPYDIKNKNGVFTSPARMEGAQWVGVMLEAATDSVEKFERGIFILTGKYNQRSGFINGCTYVSVGGKQVDMRFVTAGGKKMPMQVGLSVLWKASRDFYSPAILECTDQFRDACSFSLR